MPTSWPMPTDMSMLLELQMRLRRAVLGGDTAEIVAAIQGDGLDPAARVGIYRHHAFATPGRIDAIWRGSKEDEVPPIDITSGGTSLEIRRAGEAVSWRRLDPGTFEFRTALADGLVLAAAMAAATLKDPAFDLTAALQHVFNDGLAVAFFVSPEQETPR